MYKGTLKNFLFTKTTHRISKIVTLAVSSCLLVTMISIDASASGLGGKSNNAGHKTSELKIAHATLNRLNKRWTTISSPPWNSAVTASTVGTVVSSGTGSVGSGPSGGAGSGGETTTTTTTSPLTSTTAQPTATFIQPTSTTTSPPTTTTTAPASAPAVSKGLIEAGASRSECLVATDASNTLAGLQASVNNFQNATNSTVTCVGAYMNSAQTWTDWSDPWVVDSSGTALKSWVAEAPQSRQLVLEVDLIPQSLQDISNPLGWETSCAAGDYNSYAEELGTNLVSVGLQSTVIRLGSEANGNWSGDYVGTTTQEQSLWATCFDNEVTSLRQATGEHFLIDWGINACTQNIPYANYYPGNAYVDIVGLDFYDVACHTPNTPVTYAQLSNENYGLTSFEAFAAAQGKAMSFPEWGLSTSPSGDDPAYVNGIASTVNNGNFAFQEYFDTGSQGTLPIDSGSAPLSAAEYGQAFGNS
jgi:hypothetical protein